MTTLIKFPPEILQGALTYLRPEDTATLSLCCRALRSFIYDNRPLFKQLFLQRLDAPALRKRNAEVDWEKDVQRLVKLQKILASQHIEEKYTNFTFLAHAIADILQTAAPRTEQSKNVSLLRKFFENERNREVLLCNSSLFQRARGNNGVSHELPIAGRQLSAKLHCLYGVAIEATGRTRSSRSYPYACSKVYDLRNYSENTFWGPYMDDGLASVDWEKMEAIMIILAHNLKAYGPRIADLVIESVWAEPFTGAVPDSYSSASFLSVDDIEPALNAQDPFNVTGTWKRVVCFLDFTELFAYNFASEEPQDGLPRPPLDTVEALRIISMELRVTKIVPPGKGDNPTLPVVHFSGTSRLIQDESPNSTLRGTVRLTQEGEVRWTSISVFHGEHRWKSEGIQVGGIRSARGVLGHWFDKNHDIHGPAGPTAFWKISDKIHADSENASDTSFD